MRSATLLLFLAAAALRAQDPAVPAPVTVADFTALLERPPFRNSLGLSESLSLSGVASLPEGKMVTVWNRATRESFIVTATPNPQGWRLTGLTESMDLRSVSAEIALGGQTVTLRFDPDRLTPPKLDNTSRPAGRTESQIVVEALLRALDSEAARTFEGLPADAQEVFRKSFAGFLDTYPAAGDPQRLDFIRRSLTELTVPADPAPVSPPSAPTSPPPDPAQPNPSAPGN